jgi:hypothetical protein
LNSILDMEILFLKGQLTLIPGSEIKVSSLIKFNQHHHK